MGSATVLPWVKAVWGARQGVGVQREECVRDPQTYSYPSRKPKDALQVGWSEDVPAQHGALEARGVGLDAVEHWSRQRGEAVVLGGSVMVHKLASFMNCNSLNYTLQIISQ